MFFPQLEQIGGDDVHAMSLVAGGALNDLSAAPSRGRQVGARRSGNAGIPSIENPDIVAMSVARRVSFLGLPVPSR